MNWDQYLPVGSPIFLQFKSTKTGELLYAYVNGNYIQLMYTNDPRTKDFVNAPVCDRVRPTDYPALFYLSFWDPSGEVLVKKKGAQILGSIDLDSKYPYSFSGNRLYHSNSMSTQPAILQVQDDNTVIDFKSKQKLTLVRSDHTYLGVGGDEVVVLVSALKDTVNHGREG
ncbi:hypothetical protein PPL_02786 [Heterostelium album PN500]|uniref:Uncharacterized protein n=1 Tax=Heterostelium pallidum (strain ATCC 26659 / Pp 5 / PN500) TaxID=670386 RepID=D3B321_HETP5|nr:hypothetical protein PPL_02786 [Heterostelium album PN500]EFA83719.1 hypothetical protein PPL_02786 [Heterostelium album PN500]|eukprot:XP_020435836.1 hypothetical protein PPL_02786 [Heterostelium album PN500]